MHRLGLEQGVPVSQVRETYYSIFVHLNLDGHGPLDARLSGYRRVGWHLQRHNALFLPYSVVLALAALRGRIAGQSRKMLGRKAASTMASQNTASPAEGLSRTAGTNRDTVRPTVKTMAKG